MVGDAVTCPGIYTGSRILNQCGPQYYGSTCNSMHNDCRQNPCRNGGICISLPRNIRGTPNFECQCGPQYHGATCDSVYTHAVCNRHFEENIDLYWAAHDPNSKLLESLINNASETPWYDMCVYDRTPLAIAVYRANVDTVTFILDKSNNAAIDTRTSESLLKQTPLMLTVDDFCGTSTWRYNRKISIARILLQRGADVTATDMNGDDALTLALRRGRIEIANEIKKYLDK